MPQSLLTAQGSIDVAMDAIMKLGAYDFIQSRWIPVRLWQILQNAGISPCRRGYKF